MPRAYTGVWVLFVSLILTLGCGGGGESGGGNRGGGGTSSSTKPITTTTIDGNTLITINAKSNDLAWDSTQGVLYAAISHDGPNYPGIIAVIDPLAGHIRSSVAVSQEPSVLAISDDDQFLYLGVDPTSATAAQGGYIQRYALPTLQSDIRISLGLRPEYPFEPARPYYPTALAVAPGLPHTLALARGIFQNGPGNFAQHSFVEIYDDEQVRPKMISYGSPEADFLLWRASASSLYVEDPANPAELYTYLIDAGGLTLGPSQPITMGNGWTPAPLPLRIFTDETTGYLYTSQGDVFDPISREPVMTYNTPGTPYVAQWGIFYPDPVLNQVYFFGLTQGPFGCATGTLPKTCRAILASLDKTTGTVLHSISFDTLLDTPAALTRWGTNGLAFTTGSVRLDSPFKDPTQGQTFILHGPLVAQ